MKSIEQLKKKDLNCNIFSVYDYDGLTITELLCQFFTKITQIINDQISGNEQFGVTFMLNGVKIIKQMKISTINLNSTKMDAPTIVVGLTV